MFSHFLILCIIFDEKCSNNTEILQTVDEMFEETAIMNREILKMIQNRSFAEALDFFTSSFEYYDDNRNLTASEFINKTFGYIRYLDLPEPSFVDYFMDSESNNETSMVSRYRIDFGGRVCNFHVRNVQNPPDFRIFLDAILLRECTQYDLCKTC
ncbi:unnamed protein product [Caenorhabditis angaria]|uniref:Uncharacterized protein n=1 Tax=Caenorhabditis angaria TaxID=860376 RepID=A0A9P1I8Q3_9PELO|nr:unnamed protein product [Caenorhabditis angaria]